MRNLASILLLSFAVLSIGCAERKEAPGTRIGGPEGEDRTSVGLAETEQEVAASAYVSGQWGHIGTEPQHSDAFNVNLKGFVSATMDPDDLGFVSPLVGQSTFVHFRGRIHLKSDNTIDTNQSFLRILIKDEYVGTIQEDGGVISEVAFYFDKATSGTVKGEDLTVTFADGFGEVTLEGKINRPFDSQLYFLGAFKYKNYKHYNPEETPAQETLGGFYIPMNGIISK